MKCRPLGRNDLHVSEVALGTAALGMDYGIEVPTDFGRPNEADVIKLLQEAADAGVNLFDTAPTYGESERLLGLALGRRSGCMVATKVSVPRDPKGQALHGSALEQAVEGSIERSLKMLRRDVSDIVQIHNATEDVIKHGEMTKVLLKAQRLGKLRFLGASVYTEAQALAVIKAGCFSVLQVGYSVLDQRMATRVFPAAREAGMGLIARSVLLKGALTPKVQWLPAELGELRQAAEQARDTLAGSWEALPAVALRFCLSSPHVATVLVGARTTEELNQALAAAEAGALSGELLARTSALAVRDDRLVNPGYWPVA